MARRAGLAAHSLRPLASATEPDSKPVRGVAPFGAVPSADRIPRLTGLLLNISFLNVHRRRP